MKKITILCTMFNLAIYLNTSSQVLKMAEMNAKQIAALDREKTVVIIPGGIMEEHGPYLPSFTDGYLCEAFTKNIADAVAAKPGWKVIVFPTIPLGNSGANVIGGKYDFPGSYTVSFETLRSVFMDLATDLGDQKFKWIFVVHPHGSPNHNRALDQAGDYFHDTYGGKMVHLTGLLPVMSASGYKRSKEEAAEEGFTVHSGLRETSYLLYLRPDLVDSGYKKATTLHGTSMTSLVEIAKKPDWPGYFGAPRLARAEVYKLDERPLFDTMAVYALKILAGFDDKTIPRYGEVMKKSAADLMVDNESLQHDAAAKEKQNTWLKKNNF